MCPSMQFTASDAVVFCIPSSYLFVMPEGYGFLRHDPFAECSNDDIYVPQTLIRKYRMHTGDVLNGFARRFSDKNTALTFVNQINGMKPEETAHIKKFENLTPIFPMQRIRMEYAGCSVSMRMLDLMSPIGKGQRGLVVSPPKAGKTTLLKQIALSVKQFDPDIELFILLIDERPEEVTDIRETITGERVQVLSSPFDETAEHHCRIAEFALNRAKRLVEYGKDVVLLVDSLTRLARAYNQVIIPSGRTLSGGIDPAALYMPKKFFGAARNVREGGSLTILATALIDTGSKMDDVIFEEFKGTGNMELMLSRTMQEKRIFPAIDLTHSGTRREDLLLSEKELVAERKLRKMRDSGYSFFGKTQSNQEFLQNIWRESPRF